MSDIGNVSPITYHLSLLTYHLSLLTYHLVTGSNMAHAANPAAIRTTGCGRAAATGGAEDDSERGLRNLPLCPPLALPTEPSLLAASPGDRRRSRFRV